jgi:hypothetical protein
MMDIPEDMTLEQTDSEDEGAANVSDVESIEDDETGREAPWEDAETTWLDDGISSKVMIGRRRITRKQWVEQVEKIEGGIPSYWPVPRKTTAFLLDLSGFDGDEKLDKIILRHVNSYFLTLIIYVLNIFSDRITSRGLGLMGKQTQLRNCPFSMASQLYAAAVVRPVTAYRFVIVQTRAFFKTVGNLSQMPSPTSFRGKSRQG